MGDVKGPAEFFFLRKRVWRGLASPRRKSFEFPWEGQFNLKQHWQKTHCMAIRPLCFRWHASRIGGAGEMGYLLIASQVQTMLKKLSKIVRVRPVGGHKLDIAFADGARGVFDMNWIFERIGPMNEPLRDETYFARVFLENGALTWPNGYDLSPWNIRRRMEEAGVLSAAGVAA